MSSEAGVRTYGQVDRRETGDAAVNRDLKNELQRRCWIGLDSVHLESIQFTIDTVPFCVSFCGIDRRLMDRTAGATYLMINESVSGEMKLDLNEANATEGGEAVAT